MRGQAGFIDILRNQILAVGNPVIAVARVFPALLARRPEAYSFTVTVAEKSLRSRTNRDDLSYTAWGMETRGFRGS